jgi:hypothetical protein
MGELIKLTINVALVWGFVVRVVVVFFVLLCGGVIFWCDGRRF